MKNEYEVLVKKYHASLYRLLFTYCGNAADAEDAVQTAYLKLLHINKESIRKMMNQIEIPEFCEEDLLAFKNRDKEEPEGRLRIPKWVSIAAGFAVVLLIGTGSFAAIRKWGFTDFYKTGELPETAKEVVNTEPDGSDTKSRTKDEWGNDIRGDVLEGYEDVVTFTPTFTVCDGEMVYVGFEAEVPADSGYYLTDSGEDVNDNFIWSKEHGRDISIKDYCEQENLKIIAVSARFLSEDAVVSGKSYNCEEVSQNKVEYMLIGEKRRPDEEVSVICNAYLYDSDSDSYILITDKMQNVGVPEERKSESAAYGFEDGKEHRIGDTGIFIREVTLTNTALATYAEIWTRNEDEEYGNWISVQVVDENYELYEPGPSGSATGDRPGQDGWFVNKRDYKRFDMLPDVIYVKAHNLPLEDEETEPGYIELHRIDK